MRADVTPPGEWIRTSAASHQSALVERRMPTAAELDQAATTRPIVVKRGGHNDVVNSACLTMARITRDTPDPALAFAGGSRAPASHADVCTHR